MNSNPRCWHRWWAILPDRSRPGRRRAARAAVVALAVCASWAALAQSNIPVPRREEETPLELDVPLPAYPKEGALVPFPTDASAARVFLDGGTLMVGADRIVRYALVVRAGGGAENVTFEGLRCATGERRVYAYGRRTPEGGTWVPARTSNWTPIRDQRTNRYYFEFWRDLFCDGARTETREEILRNAPQGGRKRVDAIPTD
ncbi:MAG: CNP1-like family protein [Burkholderiales bacterium]|nr:CNP1-like family protein [Burkholderiales bacterium]